MQHDSTKYPGTETEETDFLSDPSVFFFCNSLVFWDIQPVLCYKNWFDFSQSKNIFSGTSNQLYFD